MKGGIEQDDKEFEMLLEEIPSATSGPSHLEEVRSADVSPEGQGMAPQQNTRKSSTPEAYDGFYQGYQGVKNICASPKGNNVSVSPRSSGCFPAFYGGLTFDGPGCGSSSQLQLEQQRNKGQGKVHQEMNTEQEKLQSNVSIHRNGITLPTKQMFVDDQSLTSAFANMNFKEDTALVQDVHASGQSADGRFHGPILANGQDPRCSPKVYSPFDAGSALVSGQFNGVGSLNSMQSPSNTHVSNMYGVKYPSQYRNVAGFFQATVDDMANPAMKKFFKSNVNGTNNYGNNQGWPSDDSCMEFYDSQRPYTLYSAPAPAAPEMQGFHVLPNASISGAEILSPISGLQQQYYMDSPIATYMQPQQCGPPIPALQPQMNRMHMPWQKMEEERYMRMHQQYLLLQQVQAQAMGGMPNQPGAGIMGSSLDRSFRQQGMQPSMAISQLEQPFYKYQQQGLSTIEGDWNAHLIPGVAGTSAINFSEFPLQNGNVCRYHAQGFCSRGETCPFSHDQAQTVASRRNSAPGSILTKDTSGVTNLNGEDKSIFPEKILTRTRSRGVNSVRTINLCPPGGRNDSLSNGNANGRSLSDGHHTSALRSGSFRLDNQGHSRELSPEDIECELVARTLSNSQQQQQQQQSKYTSLEEVEGRIYVIARDQHGCRFLQRKFDEGSSEDVQKIFVEIIDHIIELMTDPFGNYLVQKLLEVCNEDQRMQILHAITGKPGELVNISLNMHGTRAVQKLIETLKTTEQVSMVISSLKPGVVTLIKDLNGNHVVQRCLQCLVNEDSQFLFDAAAAHCVEIASHRHGCCVLQRCVDFSTGVQRQRLVAEIAANALVLSQDPFGNYVVQYILDLKIPWATEDVTDQLEGNYAHLSMQKFSSNVVEKCLKLAGEEKRAQIIRELINTSRLGQLLQDPYANYVVQSALNASKGTLHSAFVEAIRPHLPALRTYCVQEVSKKLDVAIPQHKCKDDMYWH
ncbi:hypothetical protein KI387_003060 [Taxus chinensis]|uniref:Uncharacterized protein n=1 Tax=Taxus chinensis TaxID=29808 RepID=A0AA38LRU9_TAXCH|nr:hypothetical protein KI387_003060 [Taxus chinensis]